MMRRIRYAAAVLAAIAVLGSCDSGPTDGGRATPGTLKVMLTSPNASDAAILIQIDGDSVSNVVVSGTGRTAYVRSVLPTRTVVAIVGSVSSGQLLLFNVPDTKQSARYTARVVDVSDATNALRATTAYTLQVAR